VVYEESLVMNEKVGLTLKVSPVTRAWITQCAKLDHRTISAYVEAFVEADAKAKKIADLEVKVKEPEKPKKEGGPRAVDIDTGDVLTRESWLAWLNHMRKMGAPLNYGAGELHFKEFCRHDADGYNCDTLVKEITERYPWKFPHIPNDWKRDKMKGGY
jgi:hypothetical protein